MFVCRCGCLFVLCCLFATFVVFYGRLAAAVVFVLRGLRVLVLVLLVGVSCLAGGLVYCLVGWLCV